MLFGSFVSHHCSFSTCIYYKSNLGPPWVHEWGIHPHEHLSKGEEAVRLNLIFNILWFWIYKNRLFCFVYSTKREPRASSLTAVRPGAGERPGFNHNSYFSANAFRTLKCGPGCHPRHGLAVPSAAAEAAASSSSQIHQLVTEMWRGPLCLLTQTESAGCVPAPPVPSDLFQLGLAGTVAKAQGTQDSLASEAEGLICVPAHVALGRGSSLQPCSPGFEPHFLLWDLVQRISLLWTFATSGPQLYM